MTSNNENYIHHEQLPKISSHELGGANKVGEIILENGTTPLMKGIALNDTVKADVLGLIEVGTQQIGLLDLGMTENEGGSESERYALARVSYDQDPNDPRIEIERNPDGSIVGNILHAGKPIVIGRNISSEGYSHILDSSDMYVSSKHASFQVDAETGDVKISDLSSTNGTHVYFRDFTRTEKSHASSAEDSGSVEITKPQEKIVENLGEVALDIIGVEVPQQVERKYEVSSFKKTEALKTLAESWGLPEGTSSEKAIELVDDEAMKILNAIRSLDGFENYRLMGSIELRDGLSQGKNMFKGSTRHNINQFIGGEGAQIVRALETVDQSLLPKSVKQNLKELKIGLQNIGRRFVETTQKGGTWINQDAAAALKKQLDTLPRHRADLSDALRAVQEMQMDLKGFMSHIDTEISDTEKTSEYRNDQVEMWAKELEGNNVTPERLVEITAEIEVAINRESAMVDDPNSPYVWFGDRIRSNLTKERAQVKHTGRTDRAFVPARRYVSELMTDMMRGKFVPKLNGINDSIMLDPKDTGGVEDGQHRVAALAMLFGNNEWQKIAKEKGLLIESR